MKEFGNIESFVEHLTAVAIAEDLAAKKALSKCLKIVEKRAKEKFGEYQEQAGPFVAWKELADSTKADRERQGYPEDEPLLRRGDTRDSIGTAIAVSGMEGQVGSDSDIALYQEAGTEHIPPRSFLGGAMAEKLPEIKEIVGGALVGALIGQHAFASLVGNGIVQGGIAIEE
jgi:HK97 gp10 family phage protein